MVNKVMEDLGLTSIQHSLIGQSLGGCRRGISGGERKRVSVAIELVSKPSIIFLDEPTSGLDSTTAYELMLTLKNLARKGGHSIVTVIHQPRTTIFDLFDGLLLLSKGEEIFSGPAMYAREVLESCPIIGTPLPEQTNIADWIIDLIHEDENRHKVITKGDEESKTERGQFLARHWANLRTLNHDEKKRVSTNNGIEFNYKVISLAEIQKCIPKYTVSFGTQLSMLTRRAMKQGRGEKISQATVVVTVAYVLFQSMFWFRLPDDTNHLYQRNSLIFFLIIAQGNGVVLLSVPAFRRDRSLLTRERSKKLYRVLPYFIAKTLSDMSTAILLPCLNSCITYWMSNLRPSFSSFFMFQIIFYLTLTTAQSFGLFMSAALPSLQLALSITPMVTLIFFIVGGFYIPFSDIPIWASWLKWTSFASYSYSGLLITEYSGRSIPCAEKVTFQIGSNICPLPGDEVIKSLGITGMQSDVWFNILMLVILQFVFRIAGYVALRRSP